MSLGDVLGRAADDLAEVAVDQAGGATVWSRAGRPFAALSSDGSAAEFLLDRRVAAAATRTPDTTPSARGDGWVTFTPSVLDPHAIDRATAWFLSAHRARGHPER